MPSLIDLACPCDFPTDIRSIGEIIYGMSDLAISISVDGVESWVNEAVEFLHEINAHRL